jgi:hypothetical protein
MEHLDGNVLAGPLGAVLAFEPTTAEEQCRGCGDVAVLAQAVVYGQPMGFVLRCRVCDDVLMVVVERDGRASVNVRGMRWVAGGD